MGEKWRYSVRWAIPHKTPPGEVVLAELEVEAGAPIPESIRAAHVPGSGYAIFVQAEMKPIRQLSQSGLASVRRKRLRRRLDANCPLFADEIYEKCLAARPEFYAGVRDPAVRQRGEAV